MTEPMSDERLEEVERWASREMKAGRSVTPKDACREIRRLRAENARLKEELRRLSGNAQELAKRWGKDLIELSLDVQVDVKANMVSGLSDE